MRTNKKPAKDLKAALPEVEEKKSQPLAKLLDELDASPEKRKTKIDSTTLIREDRER